MFDRDGGNPSSGIPRLNPSHQSILRQRWPLFVSLAILALCAVSIGSALVRPSHTSALGVATYGRSGVGVARVIAAPHRGRAQAVSPKDDNPVCPAGTFPSGGCPQPDPNNPNLYYGATPPNSSQNPVLLFVHGLGGIAQDWWTSGNDMYSLAYQAGYRTAFVTLLPNTITVTTHVSTTVPTADSFTNAITLSQDISTTVQHYSVPFVDIVAHSKGGVDTQAALAFDLSRTNPPVRYVTELSTPNQGTYLADVVCGLPPDQAAQYNLTQGPGLCAAQGGLTLSAMSAFRQMVDPILATMPVTFFVAGGADWKDTQGAVNAGGAVLQAHDPLDDNDGLVPVPSACTLAGSQYLFVRSVNHYQMRFGHYSFPYINLVETGNALVNRANAAAVGNPGPAPCVLR